jgi:hypothetical protein
MRKLGDVITMPCGQRAEIIGEHTRANGETEFVVEYQSSDPRYGERDEYTALSREPSTVDTYEPGHKSTINAREL